MQLLPLLLPLLLLLHQSAASTSFASITVLNLQTGETFLVIEQLTVKFSTPQYPLADGSLLKVYARGGCSGAVILLQADGTLLEGEFYRDDPVVAIASDTHIIQAWCARNESVVHTSSDDSACVSKTRQRWAIFGFGPDAYGIGSFFILCFGTGFAVAAILLYQLIQYTRQIHGRHHYHKTGQVY